MWSGTIKRPDPTSSHAPRWGKVGVMNRNCQMLDKVDQKENTSHVGRIHACEK